MPIAHIASGSQASSGNPSSPITFSYTVNGATDFLVLGAQTNNNSVAGDQVTGVTWNGVAMTQLKKVLIDAYGEGYLYGLPAPATGTHLFSLSFDNAGDTGFQKGFVIGEYSGVSSSLPPDNSTTGSASASSLTTTLTTNADNCWLVEIGFALVAMNAGAGTTLRVQIDTQGCALFDSNGAKSPAGSHSLVFSRSGSGNLKSVMVSLAPAGGGGGGGAEVTRSPGGGVACGGILCY